MTHGGTHGGCACGCSCSSVVEILRDQIRTLIRDQKSADAKHAAEMAAVLQRCTAAEAKARMAAFQVLAARDEVDTVMRAPGGRMAGRDARQISEAVHAISAAAIDEAASAQSEARARMGPVEVVRYVEKYAPAPPLEKVRREAHQRLRAFMVDNTIHFNGAGDRALPRVEQAWAIEHLDERAKAHNRNTIRGIADILKDYPGLKCTVHGETGRASSAPQPLADHLGLDPTTDLHRCMEVLARRRAEACLEALVMEDVPREQLVISSKGMGARHAHANMRERARTCGRPRRPRPRARAHAHAHTRVRRACVCGVPGGLG